ncbi:MAG: DUF1800 domain-containing protein [Acidobacteriota bacterium]|nr:MAG: DUF1800 domain-containing protein [Acidobacteriota bacterium]
MSRKILIWVMILVLGAGAPASLAQEMKQQVSAKKGVGRLSEEQKIVHLLDRISFGPRPGDVERVRKLGWEKYLEQQLRPESIEDRLLEEKLKAIESIHLSNSELAKYYPPPQVIREALKARGIDLPQPGEQPGTPNRMEQQPGQDEIRRRREAGMALAEMGYRQPQQVVRELQQARILRAVYSERQLQEVMTDFWFNHFNVFIQKGADRILTTSYERDTIRPRVFGKFEDLLLATAESPAMLFYLDNFQSVSPNMPQMRGRMRLNRQQSAAQQRRPRGINENYAREIMELHTLGVDGGYTQKDVQEVARCFTGWTIRNPRGAAEFVFNRFAHDDGEKVVLGHKIPAGGGRKDGETVIRILASHSSTAKFVSTKLARKFVSDDPPQALIESMAGTWRKTGGDIREVLRTMFRSREFWAAENYRAKIKTPFEMTVSAVRAIGAETNGGPAFHQWMARMGEGLYLAQPPTGYPDTAEHWVNTGALLERMNFSLALSANRIPGTRVDLQSFVPGLDSSKPSQVVDRLIGKLLNGQVSAQTRATIDKNLREQAASSGRMNNVDLIKVVGLVLGSPEFQRQ